jgi:predicted secreted protein
MAPVLVIAFELLGFSPKGDFVAYLDHGENWARAQLLDVKKNKVLESIKVEGMSEEDASKQAKQQLGAALMKRKIDRLFAVREVKLDGTELQDKEGAPLGNIEVKTKPLKSVLECPDPFTPQDVSVRLYLMGGDAPVTLLDEKRLPAERPCTMECAPYRIYGRGRSTLALIDCTTPGFEGPAHTLVPATAILQYPLADEIEQAELQVDLNNDGKPDRVTLVMTTNENVLEVVDDQGGRLFLQGWKKDLRPRAIRAEAGTVKVLFAPDDPAGKISHLKWNPEKNHVVLLRD